MLVTSLISSVSANETVAEFELPIDSYVNAQFSDSVPQAKRLWIRGKLKSKIEKVLQHRAHFIRTKYWLNDSKSVWVLEEIGKERPITVGVSISNSDQLATIDDVTVLAFRESRGWEVKHGFFTRQFTGAKLSQKKAKGLDRSIDGISGATLSVRALKKIAEIALLLDQSVRSPKIDASEILSK